ncbi:uncharacterized protein [Dysidea avara]|uniref:uncharacterized protein isoform X2 n=1 Tax=Dysidea avara TaxID=196820 RepID=UPI0033210DAD
MKICLYITGISDYFHLKILRSCFTCAGRSYGNEQRNGGRAVPPLLKSEGQCPPYFSNTQLPKYVTYYFSYHRSFFVVVCEGCTVKTVMFIAHARHHAPLLLEKGGDSVVRAEGVLTDSQRISVAMDALGTG